MIIGFIANVCGYEAAMSCIKGVAVKSGTKFIDKVAIPVGAFLIASLVGDKVQEFTEEKVVEVKNTLAEVREARDTVSDIKTSDEFCEEIVNNVFGKVTKYDENGKPIAGVYPMKKHEEEVTEDGESENAN